MASLVSNSGYLVIVDRLVILLAIGYAFGAVISGVYAINQPIWQGLLIFWLGGAGAALIVALIFKLWVCATQQIRRHRRSSNARRIKTTSAGHATPPR